MKYYISILTILGIFLCLFVKSGNQKELKLNSGLSVNQSFSSDYNLFIISEVGCMSCNKKYMKYIMDNAINRKNNLIYVAASGMSMDISPFLTDTIHNLVQEDKDIWSKYHINEGSYFLRVQNNKIDTIVHIQPSSIAQSLNYIKNVSYASLK